MSAAAVLFRGLGEPACATAAWWPSLLTGCTAGTSPVEACVEHSVEEGVDRVAAQQACEAAVED